MGSDAAFPSLLSDHPDGRIHTHARTTDGFTRTRAHTQLPQPTSAFDNRNPCITCASTEQEDGHITDLSALLPPEFYSNPFLAEPKDGSGPVRAGPAWEPVINGSPSLARALSLPGFPPHPSPPPLPLPPPFSPVFCYRPSTSSRRPPSALPSPLALFSLCSPSSTHCSFLHTHRTWELSALCHPPRPCLPGPCLESQSSR